MLKLIKRFWRRLSPAPKAETEPQKIITPEVIMKRTYKNGEHCTEEEANLVKRGKCCDCDGYLYEGLSRGLSVNVYCLKCGSRFNDMGPFGVDRTTDAQPKS